MSIGWIFIVAGLAFFALAALVAILNTPPDPPPDLRMKTRQLDAEDVRRRARGRL